MSRHATRNARASGNLTESEADATYLRGLRNQLTGKAMSERVDEASRRGAQRAIEALDRALERLSAPPRVLQVELTKDQAGQLATAWANAGARPILALDAAGLRGVGELLAAATDRVMQLELLRRPIPEAAWAALNAAYAAWRTLVPSSPPAEEWVIEDTRARGEEALFWAPNANGYTTELSTAGRYTREEADRQSRSRPTDRAHRLFDVLPLARLMVDRDALRIAAAAEDAPGRAAGGTRG